MSQTAAPPPASAKADPVIRGRRPARRLWDVAPANAPPVMTIRNPLVENLVTGPDGTVTAEYIINDCRHRGLLTRKAVQAQLQSATKTNALVRGRYLVDSKLSTPTDRSLHLTLTASSMADMVEAVNWIDRVVETGSTYNNLAAAAAAMPAPDTSTQASATAINDSDGSLVLTVPVPIQRALADARKFPLVGNLLGPDSANLKHIESQSGCQVELRNQNRPLAVSLSFDIKGKTTTVVNDAKNLIDDLIQTVKQAFEAAKTTPKLASKPAPPAPAQPSPYTIPPYHPYMPPPMMPGRPPMYGVPPVPYPGMAPYYYPGVPAHMGYPPYPPPAAAPEILPETPASAVPTKEYRFPDRAQMTSNATSKQHEPDFFAKRPRITLPDENDVEFKKFKKKMTTNVESAQRPILPPAQPTLNDNDAQRILKDHLDLY